MQHLDLGEEYLVAAAVRHRLHAADALRTDHQPQFLGVVHRGLHAGFAIGGELPVWAALLAERFGSRSFGTVMGLMSPLNMGFNLIAIGYIGKAYDLRGSYAVPFGHFVGVAVAATALTLMTSSRRAMAEIRAREAASVP